VLDVGTVAGLAVARNPPADFVDQGRTRVLAGIDLSAHLGGHLRGRLETQGHLLVGAQRDMLLLARHGVDLRLAHVDPDPDQRDDQRADQSSQGKSSTPSISRIIAVRHGGALPQLEVVRMAWPTRIGDEREQSRCRWPGIGPRFPAHDRSSWLSRMLATW